MRLSSEDLLPTRSGLSIADYFQSSLSVLKPADWRSSANATEFGVTGDR